MYNSIYAETLTAKLSSWFTPKFPPESIVSFFCSTDSFDQKILPVSVDVFVFLSQIDMLRKSNIFGFKPKKRGNQNIKWHGDGTETNPSTVYFWSFTYDMASWNPQG